MKLIHQPPGCMILITHAGSETVVSEEFVERHRPEVGGYIVRYEGGYLSYSPKEAFENGYTLLESDPKSKAKSDDRIRANVVKKNEESKMEKWPEEFGYDGVIQGLKRGERYQRLGWNGKNMYIALQTPDDNSKMSLPYIYMYTVTGDLVPWLCSQTDALAEDWQQLKS